MCAGEVVAPPMRTGMFSSRRSSSLATATISSRDGVMRPERPMMSQRFSRAVSMILLPGTMTPMSMTSKPLQARTTPTMFLPMSWTSPLTVAMRTRPAVMDFSASFSACSWVMDGSLAMISLAIS